MASEAEMFHEGERLISLTRTPSCAPVSIGQRRAIEPPRTSAEEMSYVFLPQAHMNARTCTEEEALERERPSRSDSRLEEMANGWELAGAGETTKRKCKETL